MAFTITRLNKNIDRMCQAYERLRGSYDTASIYGVGEDGWSYGAAGALADLEADILAAADTSEMTALLLPVTKAQERLSSTIMAVEKMRNLLVRNEGLVRGLGSANFSTIEEMLEYYNINAGGGYWNALAPPQWREIFYEWKRTYPAISNVGYPVLQGATFRGTTFTNALGKFVASGAGTGSFTNGVAVDYTKYSGGIGKLKISGLTGTGNVTVTGLGWNPATEAVTASVTWITSVTGDGTVTITVGAGTAPANCLIVDVTNITIAAGISAGTLYVEAHPQSGRLSIPF